MDPNYHPSTQKQKIFCRTEEGSEDDHVSQKAEKYHMIVAESNLSAESFDHSRHMICTNRKTTFVDLPPTSDVIQGHLLQAYYCTNISLKILDTTNSMLHLINFCIGRMLKKFIIKWTCKTSCGNRCASMYMNKVLKVSELWKYNTFSYLYMLSIKGKFYQFNVTFWIHFHCFFSILQSFFHRKSSCVQISS